MIAGVVIRSLTTHGDERGFFRELLRTTDEAFAHGFGQLSHSLVQKGVLKAWHAHHHQTQWTYVASGTLAVAIHDTRPASPTFRETMELVLGDGHQPRIYCMPPGVAHGYRCLAGPANVIYVTSGVYDPADEVRIPHDAQEIGYPWQQKPKAT